jgi:nitroreductase
MTSNSFSIFWLLEKQTFIGAQNTSSRGMRPKMDVKIAIQTRRAFRALEPVPITDVMIEELAKSAQLAPSCFNNQPWHFVFVRKPAILSRMFEVMSKNNQWVQGASLIIAVYSEKEEDCVLPGRDYYIFDTGMATALLILRATEMGLVAHPIAGYEPVKAKEILGIPPKATLITLVIVGKHSLTTTALLTEKQAAVEKQRPARKGLDEFIQIA